MVTTTGHRWWARVIERPRVPHEELEAFARALWRCAFPSLSWPEGWAVRWAECENCLGLCDYRAKLIFVAEGRHLKTA